MKKLIVISKQFYVIFSFVIARAYNRQLYDERLIKMFS